MLRTKKQYAARAKRLIASKAHEGDHGFTGAALRSWKHQRRVRLVALRAIAGGRRPTMKQHRESDYASCPAVASAYRQMGTKRGERWAYESIDFVCDAYNWWDDLA